MGNVADQRRSMYSELKEKILSGTFSVNERLPTTNELALQYDCSVVTAGKVIAMLVYDGLVEQRRGLGTRVIARAVAPGSASLDAFAFIYATERHEGIWRTVTGFQEAAGESQRRAVMLSTGADYSKEIEYLNRLTEFDVRGAVFYPVIPALKDRVQISAIMVESKFPIVLVDVNLLGTGIPCVVVDGFHAGIVTTRHLLERGCKRIGFFANNAWTPSVTDRYKGYCWALEEAGAAFDPDLVLLDQEMHPNMDDPLAEPTELAKHFLGRGHAIDGVVCAHDYLAHGMIRAATEKGISIPRDLRVVGIDDLRSIQGQLPLTTYRAPFETIGRKAFEVLSSVVRKESQFELETRIRGELIVRESA